LEGLREKSNLRIWEFEDLKMSNIKLFESKQIRAEWSETAQKWYFAVIDVIEILTESNNPRRYWSDLKRKLNSEGFSQLYEIIVQLKMISSDGKKYLTDCSDAKGLLRIIQSIPSPKAEPFKQWLAQVGSDRLDEIENPELAAQRSRELYKLKGYPDDWIEKRMRSIAIRGELTGEWKTEELRNRLNMPFLQQKFQKQHSG
jgi:aspartyl aminopeptidase